MLNQIGCRKVVPRCNRFSLCCSTVLLNVPGLIFFVTICVLSGMVLFAYYVGKKQCDVYAAGFIDSSNQVSPTPVYINPHRPRIGIRPELIVPN